MKFNFTIGLIRLKNTDADLPKSLVRLSNLNIKQLLEDNLGSQIDFGVCDLFLIDATEDMPNDDFLAHLNMLNHEQNIPIMLLCNKTNYELLNKKTICTYGFADTENSELGQQIGSFFLEFNRKKRNVVIQPQPKEVYELGNKSQIWFRQLADTVPAMIWMTNQDHKNIYFNKPWEMFFECESSKFKTNLIHPQDKKLVIEYSLEQMKNRQVYEITFRLKGKSGKYITLLSKGTPRYSENGDFEGYIGVAIDTSAINTMVNQVSNLMQEKQILIKELHHRVKNNLSIISSLMNIQENEVKDERLTKHFRLAKARIDSMSMMHNRIYQNKMSARVDLNDYLTALARSLKSLWNLPQPTADIVFLSSKSNVTINLPKAVPCGLLINELAICLLNHLQCSSNLSTIYIELDKLSPQSPITISIGSKNAYLVSADVFEEEVTGQLIINTLKDQLNAEIYFNIDQKTSIKLEFMA